MEFSTIFMIGGAVLLAIFVLVARLAVRWIIRITIVGLIVIALLGGAFFLWWTNRLTSKPQNSPRPAPTRRASSF